MGTKVEKNETWITRKRGLAHESGEGYMCPVCGHYGKELKDFGVAEVRYYCGIRDREVEAEQEFCGDCIESRIGLDYELIEVVEGCMDKRVNKNLFSTAKR